MIVCHSSKAKLNCGVHGRKGERSLRAGICRKALTADTPGLAVPGKAGGNTSYGEASGRPIRNMTSPPLSTNQTSHHRHVHYLSVGFGQQENARRQRHDDALGLDVGHQGTRSSLLLGKRKGVSAQRGRQQNGTTCENQC